jgi:hypothetical protein
MTESDTSDIDNKKNEKDESLYIQTNNKYGIFFQHVLYIIVFVFILFILGTAVLFTCKIAQSNVLPTDINCIPYKKTILSAIYAPNNNPHVNVNTFTSKNVSTKINFLNNYGKYKFTLLELLQGFKDSAKGNAFTLYLTTVLHKTFEKNNIFYNWLYNLMNENFNESIIILLGAPMISLSMMFMSGANMLYILFSWFYNMNLLFYKNENTDSKGEAKWSKHGMFFNFTDMNYNIDVMKSWALVFLSILLTLPNLAVIFPFITGIVLNNTLIMPLFMKAEVFKTKEMYSLFSLFKDVLKYNMRTIMFIFSIAIIMYAFKDLGTNSGVFALFAMIILVYSTEIYKKANISNDPRLTEGILSFKQFKKECLSDDDNNMFGGKRKNKKRR